MLPTTDYLQHLQGRSVLVVDDEPSITMLIKEILSISGTKVAQAHSGEQAMALLDKQAFDIVLLDIIMPFMDGHEVLDAIHQQHPSMVKKVILMTGDRFRLQTAQAIAAHPVEALYKPFDLNELRLAIGKALKNTSNKGTVAA